MFINDLEGVASWVGPRLCKTDSCARLEHMPVKPIVTPWYALL